jgi:hypothetical protein
MMMYRSRKFTDYIDVGATRVLPTFHGYAVDMKLEEFRKLIFDTDGIPCGIETIPFSTNEGDALLAELTPLAVKNKQGRLWQEIIALW